MTDQQNPKNSRDSKVSGEIKNGSRGNSFSAQKIQYQNPRETSNPDPATLREQWRFAIRQYSKWYSHAWGTAILAGISFFALGWIIKGSNPLPSRQDPAHHHHHHHHNNQSSTSPTHEDQR